MTAARPANARPSTRRTAVNLIVVLDRLCRRRRRGSRRRARRTTSARPSTRLDQPAVQVQHTTRCRPQLRRCRAGVEQRHVGAVGGRAHHRGDDRPPARGRRSRSRSTPGRGGRPTRRWRSARGRSSAAQHAQPVAGGAAQEAQRWLAPPSTNTPARSSAWTASADRHAETTQHVEATRRCGTGRAARG